MGNLVEEIRGRSRAVEGSDKVRRECVESLERGKGRMRG